MISKSRLALLFIAGLALAACRAKEPPSPQEGAQPASASPRVVVSTQSQAAVGIKIDRLEIVSMPETLTVVGRILQDAQTCHHIPAKSPGAVESIRASLGQTVDKGTVLAVIKGRDGKESRVVSDHRGVVTAAHADLGDQVDAMTYLFSVTEVDPLWGVLDIHEKSLSKVRVGQSVELRTAAYPDAVFRGKIIFVSPEIDEVTRTVKARVAVANPDGRLKLGMFLDASVRLDSGSRGLFIPRAAVQTGPEGPIAFVQDAPTEFRPVGISIGREQGLWVQVLGGLKAGDSVATAGAFMLKSEMLKDRLE
ncbi:MAG: efflux RND transporter periplasmic adaptor subunit [Elusimicrobiota bacterium]|jgi:cobalt-zinc-cadmium efflux system membrane fusion protein